MIRIEITPNSMGTRVFIDGIEINELVGLLVSARVDEVSKIHLTFRAQAVEITGDVGEVHQQVQLRDRG